MTQNYTSTDGITTTGAISRGFENHNAGESYDRDKQNIDWKYQSGASNTAAITEISTEQAYSGDQSLKVSYSSEERVKTASKWELPPEQEYFSSYWVFFPEDFEFNGVEKSGGKLPGLGSDEVPTGGDDVTGDNGYSARYMFRYDGQAELYLYHMDKAGTFGDSVKFRNDDGDYIFFQKGEWQQITQRVKVNDGDQANGEIDVWYNGEQVVDIDGVRLSDNGQLTDIFYLSTFYGGGSTLWLPPEDTEAYFDDIVISTNPEDVGLSAADIRSVDENPDGRAIGNGVVKGIQEFQPETTVQILADGSRAEIYHDKQWGDGHTATLFYTPAQDASNWTVEVSLPGPIEDIWNAEIVGQEGNVYTLRGTTKPELDAGETANIRIKASGHGSLIEFVGSETITTGTDPVIDPVEPDPVDPDPIIPDPVDPVDPDPISQSDGAATVTVDSQWNSGFTATATFTPETAVDDWTIQLRFDGEIENIWNGEIVSRDGNTYTIKGGTYNSELDAGETARVKIKGAGDGSTLTLVSSDDSGAPDTPDTPDPVTPPNTDLIISVVDTDTDTVLAQVTNGEALPQGLTDDRNVTLVVAAADPDFAGDIGSIRLTLGDVVQTESYAPYALFGDAKGDFRDGINLSAGNQELRVEVFSGAGGSGDLLLDQSTSFEVVPATDTGSGTGGETDTPDGNEGASVAFAVEDTWNGGFKAAITVTNTSDKAIDDWSVTFESGDFAIRNIWGVEMTVDGQVTTFDAKGSRAELAPGETASFGFVADGPAPTSLGDLGITYMSDDGETGGGSVEQPDTGNGDNGGTDTGGGTGGDNTGGGGTGGDNTGGGGTSGGNTGGGNSNGNGYTDSPFDAADYSEVLNKSMQFYYAQYAGELDDDHPISWRGDSVLDDGAEVGRDLSGGWFDAGDHVKFGLPMAFSATMLAWGGIEFEDGYRETGAYNDLDNHLRHVTDYLMQAYDDKGTASLADDVFHAQVGNGQQDHNYWGSPESLDMDRPVYSVDAQNPGTEVTGESAAALAASSIFFREQGDTAYADQLLDTAKQLFAFSETYQGTYNDSVPEASPFYTSYGDDYKDELAWSAAWLYKATGDNSYLDKAEEFWEYPWEVGSVSWDNKRNGVTQILSEETGKDLYTTALNQHLDHWIDDIERTGATDTNDGLAWFTQWGSNRHAGNFSLMAAVEAKRLTEEGGNDARVDEIMSLVTDQLDFMLGDNADDFSFVVGFGDNFPLNPHHRGASGTTQDDPNPNVHILEGALVGGPSDANGTYNDVRSDYITNEVATDYNSGFSGALAGVFELLNDDWG